MNMAMRFIFCGVSALLLTSTASVFAETAQDELVDGLMLVEKDKRGAIYAAPDVDWSVYRKVILEDADVAFRKDWLRDQNRSRRSLSNRVTSSDMDKIRDGMTSLFAEIFVSELSENGGWELVDEAAEDVLRIKPYIVDLDIYAPDVRSSTYSRSYTDSAGKMTLKIELFDSETGDLLARASDRKEARYRGYMEWTTSISNKSEASMILREWAQALNRRLSEATGKHAAD